MAQTSERYMRQLDVEEGATGTPQMNEATVGILRETGKMSKSEKRRCICVSASIAFFICGLFLFIMFLAGFLRFPPGDIPLSTTATIIAPVVTNSFCKVGDQLGKWLGQVGVIYNSTTSYGMVTYYLLQVCGLQSTETEFREALQYSYPVNSTMTVWFYQNTLPTTYPSNPYYPVTSNVFFYLMLFGAVLVVQIFIVLPVNFILVKCCNFRHMFTSCRWLG